MRFRQFEHKDFKAAIEASGHAYEEFMFMKKSGRLRMHFRDEAPFVFFRKTSTVLDDNNQWTQVTVYDVESTSPKIKEVDWDTVLVELKSWLKSLPN